jgi:hypothetical protein
VNALLSQPTAPVFWQGINVSGVGHGVHPFSGKMM